MLGYIFSMPTCATNSSPALAISGCCFLPMLADSSGNFRSNPLTVYALPETVELEGRRITALSAQHSAPCIGYLAGSAEGSLAYSADTTFCEAFWLALNRIDNLRYLLIENTFLNANDTGAHRSGHMTADLLAQGPHLLQHPVSLFIVHMEAGRETETIQEVLRAAGAFEP